jgi:Cu-Zn family superoxide dismutase
MTTVALSVDSLLADRGYAAHIHSEPCGVSGADAGPHYQHVVDPAATPDKPSVDPQFANPTNELWLDLVTDSSGRGSFQAQVPFGFGARPPGSVVIHEAAPTATDPGEAGTAGARLACMSIIHLRTRAE